MAKVRVYELAKELNMDSKELVDKLKAGGISIKNYMSTLDEQAVSKAREVAFGVVSEVIEEKRIKPTVIRRRKKTVTVEPEKIEPEPPEARAEAEMVGRAAEEIGEPEVFEEEGGREVEEEGEEVPVIAEEPLLEKMEAKTVVEAEEESPEGLTLEEELTRPRESEAVEAGGVAPRVKEKAKKQKKRKLDQPAKIIKKAEEGPLKGVIEKKKEVVVEPLAPKAKAPEAVPVEEDHEKREKKKKKKVDRAEETPRSALRHRKLEVFERADLYEGRLIKRKKKEGTGKEGQKRLKQTEITTPKAIKRRIKIPGQVTVGDLAKAMGVKAVELIRKLMGQGLTVNINQAIDYDTASVLGDDFGYEVELAQFELETRLAEAEDKPEELADRPPVVTIMGHVDHGKTSLLDYIRKSNVIAGERGGITQHIGAYYVERSSGGDIVFLDTPGHEAFTAMRARGAKVTDIIVLVVAADDGVMPQTREAINHGRAANIPIVVAINKIDKPEANVEKVKRELADLGLIPEDWGGQTIFAQVSAKTGEGVDELMELILLQAEILELKANPDKLARGTVVEAKLDKTKGPVATVLIKTGTLKPGNFFICGEDYGRVRAMLNSRGKRMIAAGPSVPVEIYGISGVPNAGDDFIVVEDEKTAKEIIAHRLEQQKKEVERKGIVSLDDLFKKIKEGEVKELDIIIKADVQGSIEALSESLLKLSTEEVKLKIIHSSTGAITETDVMLASASHAIIIGFNVRANPRVSELAEKEKVDIRHYDVIYNVIQDVRNAMAGLLESIYKENVIGRASIKEVFHVPKVGAVAGCYVTDGHVERNARARLLRDDVVIYDGKISSLRRFKDDVKEVQTGYECGMGLENFQDIKPGDVFEVYQVEEIRPEL
jgi:translation initiation factor IF-2